MIIPQSFKDTIEDTFNDKTVYKCTAVSTKSATDGERTTVITKTATSIKVNRLSLTKKQMLEDYGFDEKVELVLSCVSDSDVDSGEYLSFQDEFYFIDEVKEYDSHKLLAMYRWLG